MVPRFEAFAFSFIYQGEVQSYYAAVIAANKADSSNTLINAFTAAVLPPDTWDILER